MRLLSLVRLITVVLALLYGVGHLDYNALAMFFNRDLSIIAETGHSSITTAGTIGIYATAVLSLFIALFALPRWRFGVSALSWCFLLMGISLLTRLVGDWSLRYLGWYIQVPSYISTICFALPPLIMFAFLRHPAVQKELQHSA